MKDYTLIDTLTSEAIENIKEGKQYKLHDIRRKADELFKDTDFSSYEARLMAYDAFEKGYFATYASYIRYDD